MNNNDIDYIDLDFEDPHAEKKNGDANNDKIKSG